MTDLDGNGLVDGSELSAYQFFNDGNPITITNRRGQTFSDATSRSWNVIAGAQFDDGFLALRARQTHRRVLQYQVWSTDETGTINGRSRGWRDGQTMSNWGLEEIFKLDLNSDGLIGDQLPENPAPSNDGAASFAIEGTPQLGQILSIALTNSDPDGDGTPTVAWLASNQDGTWSQVGSDPQITISTDLEGRQLIANVSYIDGDGFSESVSTEPLLIPVTNADDYGTTPDSSGILALSSRLEANLEVAGDLDWFKVELENGKNYSFEQIGTGLADPLLTLRDNNGSIITSDDDSGDGLNSRINFEPERSGYYYLEAGSYDNAFTGKYFVGAYENLTQPEEPVNDGAASFAIEGTPQLGQVLSIALTNSDPDGDGTPTVAWLASNQDGTWSQVGSDLQITISADLEGRQLIANVSYIDGDGFSESVSTQSIAIPIFYSDDYGAKPGDSGDLSVGASQQGELETLGDRDWFAIELEAGKSYVFELTGATLEDPFLSLNDSTGATIITDDDGGDGLNSRIAYTAANTETYYLDAGAYADESIGSYVIKASEVLPAPAGFNSEDGYGHISASRSFENLLGISLNETQDLGGNLWGLDNINAPEVWIGGDNFSGVTGSGATIAVIDTGVDLDHPEFNGRIVPGYDFVDSDNEADDGNGHGTHVAGTIGGANDGIGITGVAPDASIMPIRVLGNDGYGYTSDIVAGVYWSADNGADVINLSLGGGGYSQAMADAIAYASNKGSVVVMAAGNSGSQSPDYPAAHAVNHGLAVGAVNQQKTMAGFSNRAGSTVLDYVTAPGASIYSTVPDAGYDYLSGTSMAAPHVAGVAGLLKSYDNSLSSESIENLIVESAENNINTSRNSLNSPDEITGQTPSQAINLQSLDSLDELQLTGRLIGNIRGGTRSRNQTIKELRAEKTNGEIIEEIDVVESTKRKFVTLDLGDASHQDQVGLIKDLLLDNQFNYFELDTRMTIV